MGRVLVGRGLVARPLLIGRVGGVGRVDRGVRQHGAARERGGRAGQHRPAARQFLIHHSVQHG
jgi:hypothetical protein